MTLRGQGIIVYAIWAFLVIAAVAALVLQRWAIGFVALATLGASMVPTMVAQRYEIRLPLPFVSFVVLFLFSTLFLGEVLDFYERYWWWDIVLHGLSAMGFGLIGFLFIFYLFEGDRYAAPAWAVAFFSWCFAMTIGTVWELFEFSVDAVFGTNMLKSGLPDTMGDLFVNLIGGAVGALSGFLFLVGQVRGGLFAWLIADFVRLNRGLFSRMNRRR